MANKKQKQTNGFWSYLVWLLLMSLALAAGARGEDRALLIGVGRYANFDDRLNGVDLDLDMMTEVAQIMGFKPHEIKVLANEAAATARVNTAFENWLIEGSGPDDRVLIYFSGHGSQVPDENNDEKDQFDEVLLLYDAGITQSRGRQTLTGVLHDDHFNRLLSRIRSRHIMVFLDACHSGSATRSLRLESRSIALKDAQVKYFYYSPMLEAAGGSGSFDVMKPESASALHSRYVAITACRDDEKTVTTARGSIFTRGLRDVVLSAARSGSDITPDEIQRRTTNYIQAQIQTAGEVFHPQIAGKTDLRQRPLKLVAQAENHALLIGIGKYRYTTLEGPPHDVAALLKILTDQYDFKNENVKTLVNEEAIKSRILHEIELLTRRTRPGDRVFIYFSGHGTSRRDELLALPLPHTTGALVPADFSGDLRQSVATLMSQLIIGKRDLRPALERLDQDRQVFMVFDTCFSGNTVRAIGDRNSVDSNRYMVLPSKRIMIAGQKMEASAEPEKSEDAYPYRNIFYISAASENEVAKDIRRNSLNVYPTIDGQPHGVLTDALLRVLAGHTAVDANHDGQWSQIELFRSVKAEVRRRFRQTPQVLPRGGAKAERLHARTFFTRPSGGLALNSQTMAQKPGPKEFPTATYQPGYSSSHALVVGIDQYRHWPHLEYAVRDAIEMAAALEAKGFQIYMLTDEQATLKNIHAKLQEIRSRVDGDSRVVFYFAGHGQTEDLPGGGERGYLVPVDADSYDWQGTMLPMDQLNQTIKQIRAKHIFMAFDSCYSGLGLTRSIKLHPRQDAAYLRKMMHSRSVQILTAGSRSEQAIEVAGHGLFTNHLLAALAGSADINSDGYITATEIYATLRPSITKKSHSRQTPQFGYIEGNGDIIFENSPPKMEPATVLIETPVSGIDVWAGTSEIGHRLSAGRHELRAKAGRTTIIVKKGGRTLFRENAFLPANGEFPIRIGSSGPRSRPQEAFTTLTIANRNVDNYSNSIARDLDGDGREEIVTAAGKHLYAFKSDGTVVWERKFDFPVTLNLIDDWNSQPAIGLTAVDYNKVYLLLLNGSGNTVWQHIRRITRYHRGSPDGGARMAKLADIDRDGRKEVIAIATANYALKPRGVIVYDQDAEELWRYTIGPNPQNIVVWEKDEGRPDIIIGTFSPGDGNNELHNHTSDLQAYVISVDGHGRTNWVTRVGEYYTGVRVLLADLEGYGRQSLYAHKYTSFRYRKDKGAIFKFSRSGSIVDRFETNTSILSIAAAPAASGGYGPEYLYAADNKNHLFKLDHDLNLLQKKSLNALLKSKPKPLEIRLVGVHDYDGDGSTDLLLYSFRRLLSDKNPLAAAKPDRKVFYSDLRFQIISHDFSKLIKSVSLADEWDKWQGFAFMDLDRPETAYYPFMALSDKIAVYNY
jgi:uncharacterized caspase-like protein